jgi:type I restriction enzyme S subunit
MISDLKPYPQYIDSGSLWIGKIPNKWDIKRFKFLLKECDDRSIEGSETLLRVSQYTGITKRRNIQEESEFDSRAYSLIGYKLVQPGDLVVNIMLAWNGSLGISSYYGIVSPAYCVYRFRKGINPRYFDYLLRTPIYQARIKGFSTGVIESRLRLYTDELNRIEAIIPPLEEQNAIVRFLEYFEQHIKRYIRARQNLIKLLNEQKQAIIHQAVTRGLDPKVLLKPSGVEWLGDIPEQWKKKPLKRWAYFNSASLSGQTDKNYSFEYIDIGTVETGRLIHPPIKMSFGNSPSRARRVLHFGDTIISTVRTYLKAVWFVNINSDVLIASTGFAVLTPHKQVDPEYLGYVLQSPRFVDRVSAFSTGTTYPAISETLLGCFHIALPTMMVEQKEILNYIKSKTDTLVKLINDVQCEINLVREFQTRLIADVVTGKVDVSAVAAQLPKEVPEIERVEEELTEEETEEPIVEEEEDGEA